MARQQKETNLSDMLKKLEEEEKQAEFLQEIFRRIMFFPYMVQVCQLYELLKAFNSMKMLATAGNCDDHSDFQTSLIMYLSSVSPKTSTDDICKWIEIEYAKLVPRGELYKFTFIRALFAAVIHHSLNSILKEDLNVDQLNKTAFRRWAPILHRFTTDYSVESCQILLFVVHDYAAPLKYSIGMLFDVINVLSENENFLSFVEDHNGWIKSSSMEYLASTVCFCLLLNAQRFPKA